MNNENSVLWIQTLDVLKSLGAPEPTYSHGGPYRIAVFTKAAGSVEVAIEIAIELGAGNVGVVANDLWRGGVITLSKEAADFGGVPLLRIQEFTSEVIKTLVGDEPYPERFRS